MKYALIGCGRISPNHIEAAKNNNLDFVAMCDILPAVMAEKSRKFGLESVRKYTDYKEMLEARDACVRNTDSMKKLIQLYDNRIKDYMETATKGITDGYTVTWRANKNGTRTFRVMKKGNEA